MPHRLSVLPTRATYSSGSALPAQVDRSNDTIVKDMNDQVALPHVLGGAPGSEGTAAVQPYLNNLVTAVFAPAMSLSGRDGQMRPEGGVEGLYVHDLRALNQFLLTVDGCEPVQLGYELVGGAANEFDGAVVGAGNPGPDLTVFVSRDEGR